MFAPRKFYMDREINLEDVFNNVNNHRGILVAYETLYRYYRGDHDILYRRFNDDKPNNKLVHNFPKLITDNATAYFVGKPITYSSTSDIEKLQEVLELNNYTTIDSELAKLSSIYGHSFEAMWINNEGEIRFKELSPRDMFVCYSPDIDEEMVCAVHYYISQDAQTQEQTTYATIYGKDTVIKAKQLSNGKIVMESLTKHYFGEVPVVEYISNADRMGDFEVVLSLVDAYNLANSDSLNDISYLNDAYLMLKNLISTDESDIADMKRNRVMLVDGDGDAQWLVKNINDLHIENIKKRLVEDIHKFSATPNISDEKFASNLSGVAISYKLNSLESKTANKERLFTIGLRKRIRMICTALKQQNKASYKAEEIYPVFVRNIPQNLLDVVQTVVDLQGIAPQEDLLALLPFIDDVEFAVKQVDKQRTEMQYQALGQLDVGAGNNASNPQQSNNKSNVQSSTGQTPKKSE